MKTIKYIYVIAVLALGAGRLAYAQNMNITGTFTAAGQIYSGNSLNTPGWVIAGSQLRVGGGVASGLYTTTSGAGASALSYSSVAFGRNNFATALDGTASTSGSWVDKDPLFIVGNGSGTAGDPNQLRNAFAIYKDGTVTMSKAQGDIGMGQFGN